MTDLAPAFPQAYSFINVRTISPTAGYCVNFECSAVDTSLAPTTDAGTPADAILAQTNSSANHIWAAADLLQQPSTSATPEPATFLLAGSMLIAIGAFRKKFVSRN
jgi:hypothetical protein